MIGGCLLTTWQIENKGSQSAAVQYTMGPTSLFINIYLQTISKYYFSVFLSATSYEEKVGACDFTNNLASVCSAVVQASVELGDKVIHPKYDKHLTTISRVWISVGLCSS